MTAPVPPTILFPLIMAYIALVFGGLEYVSFEFAVVWAIAVPGAVYMATTLTEAPTDDC